MVNDTVAPQIGRRGFLHAAGVGAAGLVTLAGTVAAQTSSAGLRGSDRAVPTPPVITRRVGRSDRSVAAVGLGTFLTFDLLPGADRDALRHVTRTYLDAGVDVVDTSPLYGTGEASLGAFLAERGTIDRLFVSNKVWSTGDFLADESHALRSFEQSQLRLWRQSMDVMFCHSLVNVDVVIPMLTAWKKEGRVRNVGISHHENAYHDIIADILGRGSIDMVQINYSIFNRSAERRILPLAAERGVGVLLNMVLEKGRLHKLVQGRALPGFASEIGAENWAQFFIKWALGHPAVTTALTATSSPEHARENVGALRGPLPNAAMRQRMVEHMETIPGFNQLASMPWYPDKQSQYQGVIRRQQARLRQRLG